MAEETKPRMKGAAMMRQGRRQFELENISPRGWVFRSIAEGLEHLDGMGAWPALEVIVEAGNNICSLSLKECEWEERRP